MEEANKRNDGRDLCTIAGGLKAVVQPRTSVCNDKDNNLIASDRLMVARWKQHSKDDMEIRVEEVTYEGPEVQIEHLTRDEVWEIIRTLKSSKSPE
jgi:hypothetical protein